MGTLWHDSSSMANAWWLARRTSILQIGIIIRSVYFRRSKHVEQVHREIPPVVFHSADWKRLGFSIAFTEVATDAKLSETEKGTIFAAFYYGFSITPVCDGPVCSPWLLHAIWHARISRTYIYTHIHTYIIYAAARVLSKYGPFSHVVFGVSRNEVIAYSAVRLS